MSLVCRLSGDLSFRVGLFSENNWSVWELSVFLLDFFCWSCLSVGEWPAEILNTCKNLYILFHSGWETEVDLISSSLLFGWWRNIRKKCFFFWTYLESVTTVGWFCRFYLFLSFILCDVFFLISLVLWLHHHFYFMYYFFFYLSEFSWSCQILSRHNTFKHSDY